MHSAYDTRQIEASQRLAYWTESICKTYLAAECVQNPVIPLHGQLTVHRIGSLEISDSLSPAMVYHRNPGIVRAHHEEHFQLILIMEGTGTLQQRDMQASLTPGDIALHSASSPFRMSYPNGSRSLVLKIPRSTLMERMACSEAYIPLTLKGDTPMGSILGNLIRECYALELEALCDQSSRLADGIIDVASVAFENRGGLSTPSKVKSPLEQIKQSIQSDLANPDILLSTVALENNISIRTLNRLFAAEGTTASRWLWLQRLEASYKCLSERRVRQVSEAAFNCGFNDLSHFSKLFKKTYGITPQQLLRANLSLR